MTAVGAARGAGWGYGAQLATVLAQFAYAAVTSRLIGAPGFGSYVIALMLAGLFGILSSAGIPQNAARMLEVRPELVRSFTTYSWLVGVLAAGLMVVIAPAWSMLWHDPGSVLPSQVLAIAVLLTPVMNATQGLLRREGKFRQLAITVVASNVAGMAVGAIAVVLIRDAVGLVISPIVAVLLQLIGAMVANGRAVWGFSSIRPVQKELQYSARMLPLVLVDYLVGAVPRLATSRVLGPSAIGFWNRADVLTSVPAQQAQAAISQALRPEFRHDIADPRRAFAAWTDLMIFTAWVAVPASALGAVILPLLVPVLFGPGWSTTVQITGLLSLGAGLQLMGGVLATAIEVIGRFRWLWVIAVPVLLLQFAGVWLLLDMQTLFVPIGLFLTSMLVRHVIQIVVCGRNGYLDLRKLVPSYLVVIGTSAAVALGLLAGIELIRTGAAEVAGWIVVSLVVVVVVVAGWAFRRSIPPIAIARRYGLLGRTRTAS